jgi:hypothetical protein
LVRCPYFDLDFVAEVGPVDCGGDGHLQALVVVGGGGMLVTATGEESLMAGQVWVLPAALAEARCVPQPALRFVLCTLPDRPLTP